MTDAPATGDTVGSLRPTVYTALFVALIAVGAFIAIPVGPVPIVLQNLFVLLAGLVLGPSRGLVCVAVYLVLGLGGLPVFAGGTSGIGKLFGPTGGYLLGYLPAVLITGGISRCLGQNRWADLAAVTAGTGVVYAAGVPWLKIAFALSWGKAISIGMLVFLPGDLLKMAAAVLIAHRIRPVVRL